MAQSKKKLSSETLIMILWVGAGLLALALLFSRAVFPELALLSIVIGAGLVAILGYLIHFNRKALKSRTAAYGLNTAVTVLLVIALVGVLNFLVNRYPGKLDLTKNKAHTLSDQTEKIVKGLNRTVKATVFAKMGPREQIRPLLDNYKGLNTKVEVEYVDPDKEPTRTKQLGIRKMGTVHLQIGPRDSKIEDVTEEKLTNALIKLLKEKSPTLCAVTGHGEKAMTSPEQEGYDAARKQLTAQAYEIKDLNLMQETKVPDTCDAIAILGPTKAFFDPEIKAIKAYLANGGRAVIASDINLKGGEFAPELNAVLADWHIKPLTALVVDPLSRMLGVDASVPILATYSKDSPITKDFQINCFFPFARPLEIIPGAPSDMKLQWLAQTTPKSWGVMDLGSLTRGEVRFNQGKDKAGPITTAIAVEGKQKDSKAPRATRLVVFGTSHFATNYYSRYGGNLDFFLNATSWVLEDESLISIRAKEEGPGKLELTAKQGMSILLLTVLFIPAIVAGAGVFVWWRRRKL